MLPVSYLPVARVFPARVAAATQLDGPNLPEYAIFCKEIGFDPLDLRTESLEKWHMLFFVVDRLKYSNAYR